MVTKKDGNMTPPDMTRSKDPRQLVEIFYHEVWNRADEGMARTILAADFRFRGSLGPEKRGADGFIDYMRSVHAALGNYRCIIEDLITSDNRAAARMTFQGLHRGPFFGIPATDREIQWAGAAFFDMAEGRISKLWVLGDVDHIKAQLGAARGSAF